MPKQTVRRILASLLLIGTQACASDQEGPSDPPAPESIHATLGASGGVLSGEPGTVLEGVRLEIPAGALASDTDITITLTEDPTPLAVGAQRVGPQLSIEPAGLALAVPANLTVPADPMWLAEFGADASAMKVWTRDGDGWTRLDAMASDADATTVTVPVTTLTTFAAGALIVPRPICNAACILAAVCTSTGGVPEAGGFCVTSMGQMLPRPEMRAASFQMDSAGNLAYLAQDATGVFAVRTRRPFDVVAMDRARFSQRVAGLSSTRINAAVRDTDEHFIVGTGSTANIDFGFESDRVRVWNRGDDGRGAVAVQDGPFDVFEASGVFRFSSALSFGRVGGSPYLDGTPAPLIRAVPGASHTFVTTSNLALTGATSPGGIYDMRADTLALNGATCSLGVGTRSVLDLAQAVDGTIAFTTASGPLESPSFGTAICQRNAIVESLPFSGSLAFDGQNALWVASTVSSELIRRGPDGTRTIVQLSNDAVGTATYMARIPVAVRATPSLDSSSVWVLTRGGELLHVAH